MEENPTFQQFMKIEKFEIVTDTETLACSAAGSITAKVCLRINDFCFPDKEWNDFVIIILNWWLNELLKCHEGTSVVFRYMDGPFHCELVCEKDDQVSISMFSRSQCLGMYYVNKSDVLSSLIANIKLILKVCDEKRIITKETKALHDSMKQYQGQ